MKSSRARSSQKKKSSLLKTLAAPSLETINAQYASNKVLLIHPSSRYSKLLIADLIDTSMCELFCYGMGIEDVSLVQFLTGWSNSLTDQAMTFGYQIFGALNQKSVNHRTLAEIFARDLEQISADNYILILDEYDRADSVVDIQIFMENLLDFLPAQCHILISSRTLPRLPWVGLIARRQAVILRDAAVVASGFYA